jgi:hypothetical protein
MASGPGRLRGRDEVRTGEIPAACTATTGAAGGATSICTCILHFTSSIGVLFVLTVSTKRAKASLAENNDAQKEAGYGAGTGSREG